MLKVLHENCMGDKRLCCNCPAPSFLWRPVLLAPQILTVTLICDIVDHIASVWGWELPAWWASSSSILWCVAFKQGKAGASGVVPMKCETKSCQQPHPRHMGEAVCSRTEQGCHPERREALLAFRSLILLFLRPSWIFALPARILSQLSLQCHNTLNIKKSKKKGQHINIKSYWA